MTYELGYTTDDDGVWLTCEIHPGHGVNLGFFPSPQDALEAEQKLGECPYCMEDNVLRKKANRMLDTWASDVGEHMPDLLKCVQEEPMRSELVTIMELFAKRRS